MGERKCFCLKVIINNVFLKFVNTFNLYIIYTICI